MRVAIAGAAGGVLPAEGGCADGSRGGGPLLVAWWFDADPLGQALQQHHESSADRAVTCEVRGGSASAGLGGLWSDPWEDGMHFQWTACMVSSLST